MDTVSLWWCSLITHSRSDNLNRMHKHRTDGTTGKSSSSSSASASASGVQSSSLSPHPRQFVRSHCCWSGSCRFFFGQLQNERVLMENYDEWITFCILAFRFFFVKFSNFLLGLSSSSSPSFVVAFRDLAIVIDSLEGFKRVGSDFVVAF